MQSSSQQPTGEPEQERNEIGQASSPFYEFPADSTLPQDAPQPAQAAQQNPGIPGLDQPPVEHGLVYPPPPSFYQNMQVPPVHPALPAQPAANAPGTFAPPELRGQFYPGGWPIPPYAPVQVQPPAKRSYKWVWIVVAIIIAALLISGGLCAWAFYTLFNTTFQQTTGSMNVVKDYFQHVQSQGYENAYRDLQISGLTQNDFLAQAQASDTRNGSVISYTVEQPAPVSSNLSEWRYTVDVKRTKTSYPVLLTVQEIGGSWKITYIDRY
jgi:hypothetical protein